MAFHKFGKTVKFPRDEAVDIHVREVFLDAEGENLMHIEIREWIKETEAYGHGIVLPVAGAKDLVVALARLGIQ